MTKKQQVTLGTAGIGALTAIVTPLAITADNAIDVNQIYQLQLDIQNQLQRLQSDMNLTIEYLSDIYMKVSRIVSSNLSSDEKVLQLEKILYNLNTDDIESLYG